MFFSITHTSTFALNSFDSNFCNHGKIHSVYNKTINFVVNEQLFSIQTAASPISPISFISDACMESFSTLSIHEMDSVMITKNSFMIGDHTFSFANSKSIDLSISPIFSKEFLFDIYNKVSIILSDSNQYGLDLLFSSIKFNDELPLWIHVANSYLKEIKDSILNENYSSASQTLSKFIGLGIGLTPSGDDFLTGCLAGLYLLSINPKALILQELLETAIKHSLHNTNDISQAFLTCAIKHQFSFAIHQLVHLSNIDQIRPLFLAIGHSSGIDSLCGIYFILDCFRNF